LCGSYDGGGISAVLSQFPYGQMSGWLVVISNQAAEALAKRLTLRFCCTCAHENEQMARNRHRARNPLFRKRWFSDDVILVSVSWYLRFKLWHCNFQISDP
jgi:hypothetical protein